MENELDEYDNETEFNFQTPTKSKSNNHTKFEEGLSSLLLLHQQELEVLKNSQEKILSQLKRKIKELSNSNKKLKQEKKELQITLTKAENVLKGYQTKLESVVGPNANTVIANKNDIVDVSNPVLDILFNKKNGNVTETKKKNNKRSKTTTMNEMNKEKEKEKVEKHNSNSSGSSSGGEYSVVDIDDDSVPSSDLNFQFLPKKLKTDKKNNNNNNNDDNNNKNINRQKVFKYVEVVRKKSEREVLPGHECEQCAKFYDALNEGEHQFDRKKFVNDCSRHKHLYEAPDTPPDFWEVSFPETETQEH